MAGDDAEQVRSIEKRLDDTLGVHVRRLYYSGALTRAPETVAATMLEWADRPSFRFVRRAYATHRQTLVVLP